tara:strand:+ start:811 stop:1056 length:246 start_codon:yes stop_codon:yes gene_type:complete
MISSPADKQKIKGAIKELSDSMLRTDAEKDLQKDIIEVTFEDTGIDKKYLRKIATIYHKQSMNDVKSDYEEVEALYDQLFS